VRKIRHALLTKGVQMAPEGKQSVRESQVSSLWPLKDPGRMIKKISSDCARSLAFSSSPTMADCLLFKQMSCEYIYASSAISLLYISLLS
jgi:hypothetical protein